MVVPTAAAPPTTGASRRRERMDYEHDTADYYNAEQRGETLFIADKFDEVYAAYTDATGQPAEGQQRVLAACSAEFL